MHGHVWEILQTQAVLRCHLGLVCLMPLICKNQPPSAAQTWLRDIEVWTFGTQRGKVASPQWDHIRLLWRTYVQCGAENVTHTLCLNVAWSLNTSTVPLTFSDFHGGFFLFLFWEIQSSRDRILLSSCSMSSHSANKRQERRNQLAVYMWSGYWGLCWVIRGLILWRDAAPV